MDFSATPEKKHRTSPAESGIHHPTGLFGISFDCDCGRNHTVEPREVLYSLDAIDQVPYMLHRHTVGERVGVIMDRRTRDIAGGRISHQLSECEWMVRQIVVPDTPGGGTPVCDDKTFRLLMDSMQQEDAFVAVGSGVVNDLAKWVAFERQVPYLCFATAASMNGYTSANVAPTIEGVKSIHFARPPVAVLSSPAIIRDAPAELTASGLGDILAKSVSSADWFLNHFLFEDYYCPRTAGLIADLEPLYFDNPEDVGHRQPRALEALYHGLLLTGSAMTMVGTSSPASGGEHLISHTLDMMSALDGESHDLHGRQVGIGTVLGSAIYEKLLQLDAPGWQMPEDGVDLNFWGPLAALVEKHYTTKQERMLRAVELLRQGQNWDNLRGKLAPMLRSPEEVSSCLRRAGAAWRAEGIGCDHYRLKTALRHAHAIRARFTILDLARLAGIMPDAIDEVVESWA